jgi:hypothetical protein
MIASARTCPKIHHGQVSGASHQLTVLSASNVESEHVPTSRKEKRASQIPVKAVSAPDNQRAGGNQPQLMSPEEKRGQLG